MGHHLDGIMANYDPNKAKTKKKNRTESSSFKKEMKFVFVFNEDIMVICFLFVYTIYC